jgi:hypothetical protein
VRKISVEDWVQNCVRSRLLYYSADSGMLSIGVKRPELEVGHSSKSKAEFNAWGFISLMLSVIWAGMC